MSTPKIASLPMYDFSAVTTATNQLWSDIHKQLAPQLDDVPAQLTRPSDLWEVWQSDRLLMAQTCGFPFVHKLRGNVELIGTPDYGVVVDKPGWYYSVLLCRADDQRQKLADFSGAIFAFNETLSQSGCHALMHTLKTEFGDERLLGEGLQTGAHALSARAVLDGKADIASVDVVTWLHLQRDSPEFEGLRVVQETEPTPGLPYIAAKGENTQILGDGVEAAIEGLSNETAEGTFVKGLWRSCDADYDLISNRAKNSESVFKSYFPNGHH